MTRIKNYKQAIMRITGMTEKEYRREYKKFQTQVHNYNAIAGTTYTPAQTLYLRYRYADQLSAGIKGILATPATRAHSAAETVQEAIGAKSTQIVTDAATETMKQRWAPYVNRSKEDYEMGVGSGDAWRIMEALNNGAITPAEANEQLKAVKAGEATKKTADASYRY